MALLFPAVIFQSWIGLVAGQLAFGGLLRLVVAVVSRLLWLLLLLILLLLILLLLLLVSCW